MDDQQTSAGNPYWNSSSQNSSPSSDSGNPHWDTSPASTDPATTPNNAANPYWDTPGDVSYAKSKVGQNIDINFCERFIEKATGSAVHFPSAISAWNSYSKNGKASTDLKNAQPGDLIFYSATNGNGNDGHVSVYLGQGRQISAQSNGVKESSIDDWTKSTGQEALGFVRP